MPRYRIIYKVNNEGKYREVESNSFEHALWEVAKDVSIEESNNAELIDTMALPDVSNSYRNPVHVNLYPDWTTENKS